jgi:hypothetical protein
MALLVFGCWALGVWAAMTVVVLVVLQREFVVRSEAVSAKLLEAKEVEGVGRTIARLQGAVSWVSSRTTCPPSQIAAEGVGQSSI